VVPDTAAWTRSARPFIRENSSIWTTSRTFRSTARSEPWIWIQNVPSP
jgi:hypothetical protein